MSDTPTYDRTRPFGLVRLIIEIWALLGGVVLLAIVLMQTLSVITGIFGRPLPGDFELTELGIAVAVFAFLPYCQLTGANVTADIFTARASRRFIAVLGILSSLIALIFAGILAWRSYLGMNDQFNYDYQTAILGIPVGLAFIPIVISLILLGLASLITLADGFSDTSSPAPDGL